MSATVSPCIGVCVLDGPSKLCLGCGRTLDEIGAWNAMSEAERRDVMAELPGRLGSGIEGHAPDAAGVGP